MWTKITGFLGSLKRRKKLIAVLLMILLLTGFVIYKGKNKAIPITTAKAEKRTIVKTVNASGETAVEQGFTKYSQLTANIKEIKVKSGDEVKEGDIVVVLDYVSVKAAADTAWSTYLSAKASAETNVIDIESAKTDVEAKRRLRDRAQETYNGDRNLENKDALKTAEADYQAAEADLLELRNKREALQKASDSAYSSYTSTWHNLSNTTIKAGKSGVAAIYSLNPGQQVTVGQKLFSIVNSDSLIFKSEVDESDLIFVKTAQEAKISLDSYDNKTFKAKVSKVSASTIETDSGSTAVETELKFDEKNLANVVGLNGEAKITVETRKNVLSIPYEYIEEDTQGSFVWIERGGAAWKQRVETGIDSEDFQEIVFGLNEGDEIIKGENLVEGSKVKKS